MSITLGYPPASSYSMTHIPESTDSKEMNSLDLEVVELSLLLPRWQALALESAAEDHGMTTAQLLRKMIRRNLTDQSFMA